MLIMSTKSSSSDMFETRKIDSDLKEAPTTPTPLLMMTPEEEQEEDEDDQRHTPSAGSSSDLDVVHTTTGNLHLPPQSTTTTTTTGQMKRKSYNNTGITESGSLVSTTLVHVLCTQLPKHWRSNKSLPTPFRVVSLLPIADGTRVWITAGNEERPHGELKNATSFMHGQEAKFNDLRFLGRSGRGKSFNVSIHIETDPIQIAVYLKAIKVTVDGPRVPRNKNGMMSRQERSKLSSMLEMKQFTGGPEPATTTTANLTRPTTGQQQQQRGRKRKYAIGPQAPTIPTVMPTVGLDPHASMLNMTSQTSQGPLGLLRSPMDQVLKMLMKSIGESVRPLPGMPSMTPNFRGPLMQQQVMPTENSCFFQRLNEINKIAERILSPILNESANTNPVQNSNFSNLFSLKLTSQNQTNDRALIDEEKYQTNSSSPAGSSSNESPTIHEPCQRKLKIDPWDSSTTSSKGFFVQNVLSPDGSFSPEEETTKPNEFSWETTTAASAPSKFDMAWQKA